MQCNIGNGDRVFRFIVGLVILGIGAFYQSWWGLIGLIPILTAAFRFCPLYLPFRISTQGKG